MSLTSFFKVGGSTDLFCKDNITRTSLDSAWFELVWRKRLHLVSDTFCKRFRRYFFWRVPQSLFPISQYILQYNKQEELVAIGMKMKYLKVPDISDGPGSWSTRDAATIGICIIDALRYIHSYGVVHMDVACENIGLCNTSSKSAVLYDFESIERKGSFVSETMPRLTYGSLDEHDCNTRITGVLDFDKLVMVLIRLIEGPLPWERFSQDTPDLYDCVYSEKINFCPKTKLGNKLWTAMISNRNEDGLYIALRTLLRIER